MKMAILQYYHRHGTDVIPCLTEELANKVAIKLVSVYRDDFDVQSSISNEEAYSMWDDLTHGKEWFETSWKTVVETEEQVNE